MTNTPADRPIEQLKFDARELPSWTLNARQICDLELLLCGALHPLTQFMGKADYDAVIARSRLSNGTLFPMPITLDVSAEFAASLALGDRIALRDAEGLLLASMTLAEKWQPDLEQEALALYGTSETAPAASRSHPVYVAGALQAIEAPTHYDFAHLRRTPQQTRATFTRANWQRVVAVALTGTPLRAEVQAVVRAARSVGAQVLLHPVIGRAAHHYLAPGDIDHYARLRCYELIVGHFPADSAMLSLLPLATRAAGERELLWRALVHKNYGCTHVLTFDAREADILRAHEAELGIAVVHAPRDGTWLSQQALQTQIESGAPIADADVYPDVIAELRQRYRPKEQRGFTLFFTGLSGSGKSTIARALLARLMRLGSRSVTLLDGDLVRKHLSSELGFSREHRDINILRIGYVASEITKHGGIAICAPIAPYTKTRRKVREMIGQYGGFFEIYVSTPLDVCEARDRKGLYAKARAGIVKEFTGVSDPYEVPAQAEIVIDTQHVSPEQAVELILQRLVASGYLAAAQGQDYSI